MKIDKALNRDRKNSRKSHRLEISDYDNRSKKEKDILKKKRQREKEKTIDLVYHELDKE
jgi:hypothetical protein